MMWHYSSFQPYLLFLLSFSLPPAAGLVTHPPLTWLQSLSSLSLPSASSKHTSLSDYIPKTAPLSVFTHCLLCSLLPSTHLSITPTHFLSLSHSLVFPCCGLCLVSVRTVITAVSSLGENKVVLCSQHHKRHERNKKKRASAEKKRKTERRKN